MPVWLVSDVKSHDTFCFHCLLSHVFRYNNENWYTDETNGPSRRSDLIQSLVGLRRDDDKIIDSNGRQLVTIEEIPETLKAAHAEILHDGMHHLWSHVGHMLFYFLSIDVVKLIIVLCSSSTI